MTTKEFLKNFDMTTKQDYENAMKVFNAFFESGAYSFHEWLKAKIAELSKPEPKIYRCTGNSWPFKHSDIGDKESYLPGDLIDYSLFPNHWQMIQPEPVISKTESAEYIGKGAPSSPFAVKAAEPVDYRAVLEEILRFTAADTFNYKLITEALKEGEKP